MTFKKLAFTAACAATALINSASATTSWHHYSLEESVGLYPSFLIGWLNWGYDVEGDYYTTYKTDSGPYPVAGVYPDLHEYHYYDEVSYEFELYAKIYGEYGLGAVLRGFDIWYYSLELNFEVLHLAPLKAAWWYTKSLSWIVEGAPYGAWAGASYELDVLNLYPKICNSIAYADNNIFDSFDDSTWWTFYFAPDVPQTTEDYVETWNCWRDPTYSFGLVEFLPEEDAQYFG